MAPAPADPAAPAAPRGSGRRNRRQSVDSSSQNRRTAPATAPAPADSPSRAGLLLTPGAGADRDHSALVVIDEAVTPEGVAVERMDFPYRRAGRRAPDRPPVLVAAVRQGAAALAERAGLAPDRVFVGGRSMGGRMCSLAVAEGMPAAGLVLVSYPLHPPGKPEKLRAEHFAALDVPCLFVSGTRDPFGSTDELEAAVATIPGPVEHLWIEGADHGLRGRDATVAGAVRTWLAGHLSCPTLSGSDKLPVVDYGSDGTVISVSPVGDSTNIV